MIENLIEQYWAIRRGNSLDEFVVEQALDSTDQCVVAGAHALVAMTGMDDAQFALERSRQAIELFDLNNSGPVELRFLALNTHAIALDDLGQHEAAIKILEMALALAHRHGYTNGIAMANRNLCIQASTQNDLAQIGRRTWDMISHQSGDSFLRHHAAAVQAWTASMFLLTDYWLHKSKQAVAEAERGSDNLVKLLARIDLFEALMIDEDVVGCERVAKEIARFDRVGLSHVENSRRLLEVELLRLKGQPEQAERHFDEMGYGLDTISYCRALAPALVQARLWRSLGRDDEALDLLGSIEDFPFREVLTDRLRYEILLDGCQWERALVAGQRILSRWMSTIGQLSAIPQFESTAMSVSTRDGAMIRQRKQVLDQLLELAQQQQGAVAHEVRNALTPVMLVASTEARSTAAEVDGESVDRTRIFITRALGQLLAIDGQLDISALQPRFVDNVGVGPLIQEVMEGFEPIANAKKVELVSSVDVVAIKTDPALLQIAVSNLVSNAIKYTPLGSSVTIKVAARRDGRGAGAVRSDEASSAEIVILDEGQGFIASDSDGMFQPFSKLSARPTGDEASTGLGLFITRQVVAGLGGTLSVANRKDDSGAVARIQLPIRRVGPPRQTSGDQPARAATTLADQITALESQSRDRNKGGDVLIVEDNPLVIDHLSRALTEIGYTSMAVSNIDEVELLLDAKWPLVFAIIDINLGERTAGAEVTALLLDTFPSLPVVITSSLSIGEAAKYQVFRGLPYLQKPYSRIELRSTLLAVGEGGPAKFIVGDSGRGTSNTEVLTQFELLFEAAECIEEDHEACEALRRALSFAELYEYDEGIARALWRLNERHATAERFSDQIEALCELATSSHVSDSWKAMAYEGLGWAYLNRYVVDRALAMFRQARHVDFESPSLEYGFAVCDYLQGRLREPPDPPTAHADAFGALEYWERELKAISGISSAGGPRGHKNGFRDMTVGELDLRLRDLLEAGHHESACHFLDELITRHRRFITDLFGVYILANERVAFRRRASLNGEISEINQTLFRLLREHTSSSESFVSEVRKLLNEALEAFGPGRVRELLEKVDRAIEDFDRHRTREIPRVFDVPVTNVVAHLSRGTERYLTSRRIVMLWALPDSLPPAGVDLIDSLQEPLMNQLKKVPDDSIVEVSFVIDGQSRNLHTRVLGTI